MSLRCPTSSRRRPAGFGWLALVVVMLSPSLPGQATREYDLKAVFLFNFATFVEWPAEVRPPPGKPIIIGVLGRDPFGSMLDQVVAGERLNENPLEVRRYRTTEAAMEAHILYISASEAWRMPQILRALRGKPVLTVADLPGVTESEAIITFATKARLELRINSAAAQQSGLNISSKLLRVAGSSGRESSP